MQLISKIEKSEHGFIELILLTFLAIILVQINSLWTLSKLKLTQEKISLEILNADNEKKRSLYQLLKSDPMLSSVPSLSPGFKTTLRSPNLQSTFSISDRSPSLNWLFYDSQNIGVIACGNLLNLLCNLDRYSFTSSKIAPFSGTNIQELNVNANIEHPTLISLGNLTIEHLILNPISVPKFKYLLMSSYSHMKIDRISGIMPSGTKLLLYSVIGEISIRNMGINKPCDNNGVGTLVFISPSVKIAGENRADLKFSDKTCLKDFPNQIFTSIKIASIH